MRQSSGAAVTATDGEILDAVTEWASVEGIFAAPEGAAALVAYRKLVDAGVLAPEDRETAPGMYHPTLFKVLLAGR